MLVVDLVYSRTAIDVTIALAFLVFITIVNSGQKLGWGISYVMEILVCCDNMGDIMYPLFLT